MMVNKRLLIIDDCVEDRQILRRYLSETQSQAVEIEESDSAQAGYKKCQNTAYDLVLLDWRLPDEDGLEVLKTLITNNPSMPVVMVSAYGNEELAVKAIKTGAKDYLGKQDLSAQRLFQAVEPYLEANGDEQTMLGRSAQNSSLLAQVALRIRQTLDLENIINTAVNEVRSFFGCDRVVLCQFDSDMKTEVVSESVAKGWPSLMGQLFQDEYFQREGREHYCTGKRQITDNIFEANLSECHRNFLVELQVKSILVLPILANGKAPSNPKLWGLLAAHHCNEFHQWRPDEIQLFEELAIQLSIAIQQAELLDTTQVALQQEQKLNQLKSQFIATVSHEYRSPLATILAASTTLKRAHRQLSTQKQFHFLSLIEDKVRHMTRLVDSLLSLQQFESNEVQFAPQLIDLETLISRIVSKTQEDCDANYDIQLLTQGNFKRFLGDPGLLHLIVDNLLSNAVKYSPDGGTINVQLQDVGEYVQIEVSDQGIGIPETDQREIFESFKRGGNADVLPGTGVGLSIVKMCTKLHRGNVSLHSVVDQGTSIIIRLPKLWQE